MDPLSISSAIGGLVTVCGQTISTCRAIIGSLQDAPRILSAIQAECSTTRESLSNIFILINKSDTTALSYLSSSDTLSRSFDIALTGCTVTFSVLDNELQKILKRSENEGKLDFRQRAKYVWNEGVLKDAMDELRGQRDALNLLITVVQSHSISEILSLLKAKDTVFQDVKRRTDSLYRPRGNVGQIPDDRWDSDTLSIFSEYTEQKFFDFDSDIMKSPAYTRVYSSVRNTQKPRRPLKTRLEPIVNLLDEDLIDLHDHPPLFANYSLELENEMSPGSMERSLSVQQSTTSPDFTKDTIDDQIIDVTDSPGQTRVPDSTSSHTASIEDPEALRGSVMPYGGEQTPRSPENENGVYAAAPAEDGVFSVDSGEIKMDETKADEGKIDEPKPDEMRKDKTDADETISTMDGSASVSENVNQMSLSEGNTIAAQDGLRAVEHRDQNLPHSSVVAQQTTALYALESIDLPEALPSDLVSGGWAFGAARSEVEDGHKLVQAAASGDSISVRKQLLQGTPISDPALQLALLSASLNGCVAVVEMLLLRGANINYRYLKEVTICQSPHVNLTPLHLAAAANQGSTVELLLKCGADVSSKDDLSWTPLHFAAARGCTSALQVLLKYDAVTEAQASLAVRTMASSQRLSSMSPSDNRSIINFRLNKCTPLYVAAAFGALETVILLVDHGANKNVKAEYGLTILHAASLADCANYTSEFREVDFKSGRSIEFVRLLPLLNSPKQKSKSSDRAPLLEYLIEIGCDPAVPDDYGFTPLHVACLHSSDIASALVRHTNNVSTKSKFGWTPLHLAALWTDVSLATILIQAGARLELALISSIGEENEGRIRKLYIETLTPLGLAVAKANSVMVVHLLKNGANPQRSENPHRRGVLNIAVTMGETAMLVLLSEQGVGFEQQRLPASNKEIKQAIEHGFSTELYLPKSFRIDVNTLNRSQMTPLLQLIQQDNPHASNRLANIQCLLDLGANPGARYQDQKSVLHCLNKLTVNEIRVLVKAGAPLEAKDDNGLTPLLWGVLHSSYPGKVRLLIELGAKIYAKDNSGRSAWKLVSERYKEGIGSRALSAISLLSVSELTDDNYKSEMKKVLNNAKKSKTPPPGWRE